MDQENLIHGTIFLLGGLVATLMAYEKIRPNRDPAKAGLWLHKHGRSMKVLGPMLMAYGAARLALGLLGAHL